MSSRFVEQLIRIAAWCSQGGNVIFLGGHQDQTISARAYENRDNKYWNYARIVINKIFFWQEDHCYHAYMQDIAWASELIWRHRQ